MKKLFGSRLKIILLLSVILVSITIITVTTVIVLNNSKKNNSKKYYTMKIEGIVWNHNTSSSTKNPDSNLLSLDNVKIPNTSKTLKNVDILGITSGYIYGYGYNKDKPAEGTFLNISNKTFPFKVKGQILLDAGVFDFAYDRQNTEIIVKLDSPNILQNRFKGESFTIKFVL